MRIIPVLVATGAGAAAGWLCGLVPVWPLLRLITAAVTGVVFGALTLLVILVYLAGKIAPLFRHQGILKRVPGVVLLGLGIYAFAKLIANL